MKSRMFKIIIACIVFIGIVLSSEKVFAAKKKYVKSITVNTKDLIMEEGENASRKFKIKTVNKASKKITVKVYNKNIVSAFVEGDRIIFKAKASGKTAVVLTTKANNKKGKKITKKIYVKVESKEKDLVYFDTYAQSGYICASETYKSYTSGMDSSNKFTDNLGKTYRNGINRRIPNFSLEDSYIEYRVDDYNYLKGVVILNYWSRSSEKEGYMKIFGDGEEIYCTPGVKKGVDPFDVNLDISGIRVLRIEFTGEYSNLSFVEPKVGK